MTLWRCDACNIEGPAESFPTHTTPSLICPILKMQTTVGNKRLACPGCGGRLTPKPFDEIFVEAFDHEIASSDANQVPARDNSEAREAVAVAVLAAAASSLPTGGAHA